MSVKRHEIYFLGHSISYLHNLPILNISETIHGNRYEMGFVNRTAYNDHAEELLNNAYAQVRVYIMHPNSHYLLFNAPMYIANIAPSLSKRPYWHAIYINPRLLLMRSFHQMNKLKFRLQVVPKKSNWTSNRSLSTIDSIWSENNKPLLQVSYQPFWCWDEDIYEELCHYHGCWCPGFSVLPSNQHPCTISSTKSYTWLISSTLFH